MPPTDASFTSEMMRPRSCGTKILPRLMKIRMSNHAFQWVTIVNNARTAITGLESGRISRTKTRSSPAPSMRALSVNSSGRVMKKLRVMIIQNRGMSCGSHNAHMVLYMPSPRTIRNSGTMPPVVNMAMSTKIMYERRNGRYFFDSG